MTKSTTYHELMLILADMEAQGRNSITWGIFNRTKIDAFYKANDVRIKLFQNYYKELVERLADRDDLNNVIILNVEGGGQRIQFSEENQKTFDKEYFAFLKNPIQLHI